MALSDKPRTKPVAKSTPSTDKLKTVKPVAKSATKPQQPTKGTTSQQPAKPDGSNSPRFRIPQNLVDRFPALWFINSTIDTIYGPEGSVPAHINMNTVVAEFYRSDAFSYYDKTFASQKGVKEMRNHMAVRGVTNALNQNADWHTAQNWKHLQRPFPKRLDPAMILAALCVSCGIPQNTWVQTDLWESHAKPLIYNLKDLPAFWAGSAFDDEDWIEEQFGKKDLRSKSPSAFRGMEFNSYFGGRKTGWPSFVKFGKSTFLITGPKVGWTDGNWLECGPGADEDGKVKPLVPRKRKAGETKSRKTTPERKTYEYPSPPPTKKGRRNAVVNKKPTMHDILFPHFKMPKDSDNRSGDHPKNDSGSDSASEDENSAKDLSDETNENDCDETDESDSEGDGDAAARDIVVIPDDESTGGNATKVPREVCRLWAADYSTTHGSIAEVLEAAPDETMLEDAEKWLKPLVDDTAQLQAHIDDLRAIVSKEQTTREQRLAYLSKILEEEEKVILMAKVRIDLLTRAIAAQEGKKKSQEQETGRQDNSKPNPGPDWQVMFGPKPRHEILRDVIATKTAERKRISVTNLDAMNKLPEDKWATVESFLTALYQDRWRKWSASTKRLGLAFWEEEYKARQEHRFEDKFTRDDYDWAFREVKDE